MNRKPLSFSISVTVTNKSGSNTTPVNSAIYNAGGYLRQIIVVAPFPTATFNFRIQNSSGHNVLKRTEQVGELIDDIETPMPAGTYTCYVENASHDGVYSCEIVFAEVY